MLDSFTVPAIVSFFFKGFAIVLSALYLVYAVVFFKQTQVMNKALTVGRSSLITLISFLQIMAAVILLILAFGII